MTQTSGKTHYETLGIDSSATDDTIKAAYRKLARKYHPDLNKNDEHCVEMFKEVSLAYEILSDPEKKKNYDIIRGFYEYAQNQTKTAQAQASKAYKESQKKSEAPKKNVFDDILDTLKNQKKMTPKRGSDVNSDVTITMAEAQNGTTRTINVLHTEVCPNCQGRKFINGAKCPMCNGVGEQSSHKKIKVKIPPKVKHGAKIRIANEGNIGYNGGKNGDLYLNIKIESNSIFKFDDINVLCNVPITPFEAALGGAINVPSIDGTLVKMKLMPATSNGQKYRLAGQGLKKDGKIGDMIVTVHIEVAKNLSQEEIRLYEELKRASKHDVRENLINGM